MHRSALPFVLLCVACSTSRSGRERGAVAESAESAESIRAPAAELASLAGESPAVAPTVETVASEVLEVAVPMPIRTRGNGTAMALGVEPGDADEEPPSLQRARWRFAQNKDYFDEVVRRQMIEEELDPEMTVEDVAELRELLAREFTVKALRHPYRKGNFSWQLLAGAEFAEDDDSFSSPKTYVRFIGDTAFHPEDLSDWTLKNVHTVADISISTIPVAEGSGSSEFIDSEKALTGSVGMDWLIYQRPPTPDGYHVQAGVVARVGLQSLDTDEADLSSENEFWRVGVTIRTSPIYRLSDPNPLPYGYATLTWGEYDTLREHAVTLDGMIRFLPDQDTKPSEDAVTENPVGLFIGMRAIVDLDEGDDDLRFQVGVQDGLALLQQLLALPASLFGYSDEG